MWKLVKSDRQAAHQKEHISVLALNNNRLAGVKMHFPLKKKKRRYIFKKNAIKTKHGL